MKEDVRLLDLVACNGSGRDKRAYGIVIENPGRFVQVELVYPDENAGQMKEYPASSLIVLARNAEIERIQEMLPEILLSLARKFDQMIEFHKQATMSL